LLRRSAESALSTTGCDMKSPVWLLKLRKAGFNLVFSHQYSTETCVRSNSGVGSSQNNVALPLGSQNREEM